MILTLQNWFDINSDEIIIGTLLIVVGILFGKIASIKWGIPPFIKTILNMKIIEVFSFFFQYLLTPIVVIKLILESYDKPFSFKIVIVLIFLFSTYFFNILIYFILDIYKTQIVNIENRGEDLKLIKKALETVYQEIEELKIKQMELDK